MWWYTKRYRMYGVFKSYLHKRLVLFLQILIICISYGLLYTIQVLKYISEKFEDTKGVIRSRKSKNERQCNDQNKKDKRRDKDLQNTTHNKLKKEVGKKYWLIVQRCITLFSEAIFQVMTYFLSTSRIHLLSSLFADSSTICYKTHQNH